MNVKKKKACLVPLLLLTFASVLSACNLKNNYLCADGTTCIPKSYICNGHTDCPTFEDEQNCGKKLKQEKRGSRVKFL